MMTEYEGVIFRDGCVVITTEMHKALIDRMSELDTQLKTANERADKAAQDGWLKTAETQLARAKKAEAKR